MAISIDIFIYGSTILTIPHFSCSSLHCSFRALQHPNLCLFIGCVLNADTSALLYEYCPRGSLRDILYHVNVDFDWMYCHSFARDIARAMSYLHSKKIVHGKLSSKTCVLDEDWIVKITGMWSTIQYGVVCFHVYKRTKL